MLGLVLLRTGPSAAGEEPLPAVDDEYQPGLVGTYTSGGHTIERIDPGIAFDWRDSSPDTRLPEGRFRALWRGNLLVRQPGRYRWHAFVSGTIRVRLGGREVLEAQSAVPGWKSGGEVELAFGEQSLEID